MSHKEMPTDEYKPNNTIFFDVLNLDVDHLHLGIINWKSFTNINPSCKY